MQIGLRRLACMAVALSALTLGWASPAWADPPSRVGRIDDLVGAVWVLPYGTQDWVQAVRNQPVSVQDRIATDPGGRVEVDIGSTTVRVGDDSEVWMQQLDDNRVIVDVERGSITARLRTRQAALAFTALTDEGKYAPLQAGYYRFDQVPPGSKTTVYEGSVRFDGPDSTLVVSAGQQAEFWREPPASAGGAPGPTNYTLTAPERDAFEQWSTSQDQAQSRLQQPVYVSPEMPGASDLQQYGQWSDTPEYGALWTPTAVAADWAPYTDGRWDWVDPWGWTWIDASTWGFAPFHYGRWVRYRDRWGWAPGAYVPKPVYAPALVGWVGNAPPPRAVPGRGPGPSVGWFPLSPRDAYVPGFKATPGYIRGVNAGHARAIPNLNAIAQNPTLAVQNHQYLNRGVPGALTVVPASVVSERQFVPGFRQRGNERGPGQGLADLSRAPVRPAAPVGAPPPASPRAGVGPRFAQNTPSPAAPALAGQPAAPQTPAGFGRGEGGRGGQVPGAPAFAAPGVQERRYQQQPVPRGESQGLVPTQGQPVPRAAVGGPSGDSSVTRFNHAPEFQGQPQIRPPEAQPPRGEPSRFGATEQVQRAQQQQMEQQQQLQRQQQFQIEQQQRQQRAQIDQQQIQQRQQQAQMEQQQRQQQGQIEQQQQQQRQQQFQMEQQRRQQQSQMEQQQQQQRQQQFQMEQQRRQQQAQMEQQQQQQRQQQFQMEQQQRQQRAQVEQQQQMQRQQQFQMEQQQRQQRAQVEQQQQMQRQQQMQIQMQQQQQRQQQAQPPRGGSPGEGHNRGDR